MATPYGRIIVTTSATLILASPIGGRKQAIVTNFTSLSSGTAGTLYVGFNSSVTTLTGFPINQYDTWETNEPRCYQGDLYGIAPNGTIDVRFEEVL